MFLILFLIALFLFLTQVKTLDLGLLGKTYYIGVIGEEATRISDELYYAMIVFLVLLGLLTIRGLIKSSK